MATLKQLIECEISDFFAGFGHPGEPETPEEMQSQLLARVMPLLAGLEQEPVAWTTGVYRQNVGCNFGEKVPGEAPCIAAVYWDRNTFKHDTDCQETSDRWLAEAIKNTGAKPLYAAPQLPQPVVDELLKEHLRLVECMLVDYRGGNSGHAKEWIRHISKSSDKFEEKHSLSPWLWMRSAYRAAMLQGAEPPAYEIKRFGEFSANGLTRDDGELAISIQLFQFDLGTTPQPVRGEGIVEKYALQAIINALQQQCDRLSDAPIPVIWPAAPQQEVKP